MLRQAQAAGIRLARFRSSTACTVADVDNDADRQRQEQGGPPGISKPRGQERKASQTGPDGKISMQDMQYLGYKSHISFNAETGLITSLEPTTGSAADNKQVPQLLAHDAEVGVPAEIYAGRTPTMTPSCITNSRPKASIRP